LLKFLTFFYTTNVFREQYIYPPKKRGNNMLLYLEYR